MMIHLALASENQDTSIVRFHEPRAPGLENMLFFPYMLLLFLDGRYGGHRAPADPKNRCILKSRDHELFYSFGFESLDVRALENELPATEDPRFRCHAVGLRRRPLPQPDQS